MKSTRNRTAAPGRFNAAARLGVARIPPLLLAAFTLAFLFFIHSSGAQELRITDISIAPDGKPRMQFQTDTNYYYILLRGAALTNISTPAALTLTSSTNAQLTDSAPVSGSSATFFRIQRVPLTQALDTDNDGIDDVYELRHAADLQALDATDASKPAPTGRTWLDQYRLEASPLTKIVESSPANGESGVAVMRETIFRFNNPLAPSTLLNTNSLCACFGGRQILSRIELSTDRKKATLFYQEPLPASARVRVTFNGANLTDYLGRALDLDGDGQPGGNAIVDFDTLSITPVTGTAVIGHVFASLQVPVVRTNSTTNFVDHPLPGVLISVIGAEQEIFTTTDAQGFFRLTNCPAGKFFVSIDGRTSPESNWPNGDYYPLVGKPWEAVAGRTNLAGTSANTNRGLIYLPLVQAGTLQPVNPTADTTIGFPTNIIAANPAWAGVSVTIPTNALFSDNGTRGGRVGLAPVPADRLPERLPAGIVHALDISIQTDGPQNVDRPLPVRFPNLPDPQTGLKLPPGAKSALMSYNHDTGRWEVQGPMTVTADGNYVETDPGVGVRQPGWHGAMAGSPFMFPPLFFGDPPCIPVTGIACVFSPNRRKNPNYDPNSDVNGCSAPFGIGNIPPGTGGISFEGPCNIHDVGYGTYTEDLWVGKALADAGLCVGLHALCSNAQGLSAAEHVACEFWAGEFCQKVILFGWPLFLAAQAKASICDCPVVAASDSDGSPTNRPSGRNFFLVRDLFTGEVVTRGTITVGESRPMIVRADNGFEIAAYNVESGLVGKTRFLTSSAGTPTDVSTIYLNTSSPDSDGDGLSNLAEFILGTNPNKPDSDGDGVQDGVEIQDGTDPLDGLPASIGIIAATDTPGTAVDVCAINDLAVVANREAGVSVLNVAGQNPIRIAEVDTPGTALRVACSGNLIAVADGASGLAIIDITDPPAARILHQVNLGSPAQAVAAAGGLAYAGLANGEIVTVDLASGFVLSRRQLGASVQDLALSGDHLLAVTSGALLVLNPYELDLPTIGSVGTSGALRLVAGNGFAYVTVGNGFDTFTFANPSSPTRLRQNRPGQSDWRQIVVNGSGFGIAAVNLGFGGSPLDVELYSLPAADQPPQFTTRINTPGESQAVSIYNGRAYVADGVSGLQVINYLAYDNGTNPPSITLSNSFTMTGPTNGVAEEGKLVRVTASVTDDVQVRNVEFYVDGVRVLTDGNFPFEHRFVTPRLTASKTNFIVRAKATDTGGNLKWSQEVNVALVRDATPPRVLRTDPATNSIVSITNPPSAVFAYFNEPMDIASLGLGNYQLVFAGADNRLGTADDRLVTNAAVTYRHTVNAGVLEFSAPLGLGVYQGVITTNVTDAAGNHLTSQFRWTFSILAGGPNDDDDGDDVTNADEVRFGLNPFAADTDGDGWSDRVELDDGTSGADPASRPSQVLLAYPPVQIDLPSPDTFGNAGVGLILARPPVLIDLPSPDTAGTNNPGLFLAQPPVNIKIPTQ